MKNRELYARLELIDLESEQSLWSIASLPEAAKVQSPVSQRSPWTARIASGFRECLEAVGQSLVTFLCGSSEPRILTKRDRHGQDYWVAYDPVMQVRLTFTSERELRKWLDKRYYQ